MINVILCFRLISDQFRADICKPFPRICVLRCAISTHRWLLIVDSSKYLLIIEYPDLTSGFKIDMPILRFLLVMN